MFFDYLDLMLPILQLALLYGVLLMLMLMFRRDSRERRQRRFEDSKESLESKLRLLSDSSVRAADLSSQINVEIEAMLDSAARAKADADEAQQIAQLSDVERKAVASMVRAELGNELSGRGRREIWVNIGLSAGFFVLGVVASIIVTMNVRPAEPAEPSTSGTVAIMVSASVVGDGAD